MAISSVKFNNVSFGNAAAPNSAPQGANTQQASVPKKEMSLKSTIFLTVGACLAAYGIVTGGKSIYNHFHNIKECRKIEEGAKAVFEKIKEEIKGLVTAKDNNNYLKNIPLGEQEGFLAFNKEGAKIGFFNKFEDINTEAQTLYRINGGIPTEIYSGFKTSKTEKGSIMSSCDSLLFLNPNSQKYAKSAQIVVTKDTPMFYQADEIFNVQEGKVTSYGNAWQKFKEGLEFFRKFILCDASETPKRVELNSTHDKNKISVTKLFEKNNKGNWKSRSLGF